jgi:hypothetical protein
MHQGTNCGSLEMTAWNPFSVAAMCPRAQRDEMMSLGEVAELFRVARRSRMIRLERRIMISALDRANSPYKWRKQRLACLEFQIIMDLNQISSVAVSIVPRRGSVAVIVSSLQASRVSTEDQHDRLASDLDGKSIVVCAEGGTDILSM